MVISFCMATSHSRSWLRADVEIEWRLGGNGVVPYLPLDRLNNAAPATRGNSATGSNQSQGGR